MSQCTEPREQCQACRKNISSAQDRCGSGLERVLMARGHASSQPAMAIAGATVVAHPRRSLGVHAATAQYIGDLIDELRELSGALNCVIGTLHEDHGGMPLSELYGLADNADKLCSVVLQVVGDVAISDGPLLTQTP